METLPLYLQTFLVILLATSFVKVSTSLAILKHGLGLQGYGFGAALLALSLALSILVMDIKLQAEGGISAFMSQQLSMSEIEKKVTPFLESKADKNFTNRLNTIVSKNKKVSPVETSAINANETPIIKNSFGILLTSFIVSELKSAFQLGVMLLIPFIVIDLLVVNILMSLSITQISASLISLPLKLLTFFVVDGWTLLTEKLLGGYF